MKVVLTRAGGPLADRLVPRLLAAGHDVRVPAPPAGVEERRSMPVGVRVDDGRAADVVVALSPDPAALRSLVGDGVRVVVVTDRRAAELEDVLAAGASPWTLQVTGVLHDDLARAVRTPGPLPRAATVHPVDGDEVADRIVRLLRVGAAGRVPDAGGPRAVTIGEVAPEAADGPVPPTWPADWLEPRRATGTIDFVAWSHRSVLSGPTEPVEGCDEAAGAHGFRRAAGNVEEG